MSKSYYFLKNIVSNGLKENPFLSSWDFLECWIFQNEWILILLIISLVVSFEILLIKICTALKKKPVPQGNRTLDSKKNEDSFLEGVIFALENLSNSNSSSQQRFNIFSERRMPTLTSQEFSCENSWANTHFGGYQESCVCESSTPFSSETTSSLSFVHSEVKEIFITHKKYSENEYKMIQLSTKSLYSIMKTNRKKKTGDPSDFDNSNTSTFSAESECFNKAPCPPAHLILSRNQIQFLEDYVRNQIPSRSKAKLKRKNNGLCPRAQESLVQNQHPEEMVISKQVQDSVLEQSTLQSQFAGQLQQPRHHVNSDRNQPGIKATYFAKPPYLKEDCFSYLTQDSFETQNPKRHQQFLKAPHVIDTVPKGQQHMISFALNHDSVCSTVPPSPALEGRRNRRKTPGGERKLRPKVPSLKAKRAPTSRIFSMTACHSSKCKMALGHKKNIRKKNSHENKLLGPTSESMQKPVPSPKIKSSTEMKTCKDLQNMENGEELIVSTPNMQSAENGEEPAISTPDMQRCIPKEIRKNSKDCMDIFLQFSGVNLLISLASQKREDSDESEGIKVQVSTESVSLEEEKSLVPNMIEYLDQSEREEVDCNTRSDVKNMDQDEGTNDAFYNATYSVISEPLHIEMPIKLKASTDMSTIGSCILALKQEKPLDEKMTPEVKHVVKSSILKELQECVREKRRQEEGHFRVGMCPKPQAEHVRSEMKTITAGSRKAENEQDVPPQSVQGSSPRLMEDPVHTEKMKQITHSATDGESTTDHMSSPETLPVDEYLIGTTAYVHPFGRHPGKTAYDHIAEERGDLQRDVPEAEVGSFKIRKKMSGTKNVLGVKHVITKEKKPAASLILCVNKPDTPRPRKRLGGGVEGVLREVLHGERPPPVLLRARSTVSGLPDTKMHSKLNAKKSSHFELTQQKSQVEREEKKLNSPGKEHESQNTVGAKLRDDLPVVGQALRKPVPFGKRDFWLDACPGQGVNTEEELYQPISFPGQGVNTEEELYQPISFPATTQGSVDSPGVNPSHVANMKRSTPAQAALRCSTDWEMSAPTPGESLMGDLPRDGSIPSSQNDARKICNGFTEKGTGLLRDSPAALPDTLNYCRTDLPCKEKKHRVKCKDMTKTVNLKSRKARVKSSLSQTFRTASKRKKSELDFKTKLKKINQAKAFVPGCLDTPYSFSHDHLRRGQPASAKYLDIVVRSSEFYNREGKIPEAEQAFRQAAPQPSQCLRSDAYQMKELRFDEPSLSCLTQEQPAKGQVVPQQNGFPHTALSLKLHHVEVKESQKITQTESDMKFHMSAEIMPLKAENISHKETMATTEAFGRNSERELGLYPVATHSEISNDLQVTFLQSSDSVIMPFVSKFKRQRKTLRSRKQAPVSHRYRTMRDIKPCPPQMASCKHNTRRQCTRNRKALRQREHEADTVLEVSHSTGGFLPGINGSAYHKKDRNLANSEEDLSQSEITSTQAQPQANLTETSLCSTPCPILDQSQVEKLERCFCLSPVTSGGTKEGAFSTGEDGVLADERHHNGQAAGGEKKQTVALYQLALSISEKEKNKQSSVRKASVNLKYEVLKAKKPSISCMANFKGTTNLNHTKKTQHGPLTTVTPIISIDSKTEIENGPSGETALSSTQARQEMSQREGDTTLDGTKETELHNDHEEEGDEELFEVIPQCSQHFIFCSAPESDPNVGKLESTGTKRFLFVMEQDVPQQCELEDPVKGERSKKSLQTPKGTLCPAGPKRPPRASEASGTEGAVPEIAQHGVPADGSHIGVLNSWEKEEKAGLRNDLQGTVPDFRNLSTSILPESRKEKNISTCKALQGKMSPTHVLMKGKEPSVSKTFNLPQSGCQRNLLPKILKSQFAGLLCSGALADRLLTSMSNGPMAENDRDPAQELPATIPGSLDFSKLSSPSSNTQRGNLQFMDKGRKVSPKCSAFKAKISPVSQTLKLTDCGTASHKKQLKCNSQTKKKQDKSVPNAFLTAMSSPMPVSLDLGTCNRGKKAGALWEMRFGYEPKEQQAHAERAWCACSIDKEGVSHGTEGGTSQGGAEDPPTSQCFRFSAPKMMGPTFVKSDLELKNSTTYPELEKSVHDRKSQEANMDRGQGRSGNAMKMDLPHKKKEKMTPDTSSKPETPCGQPLRFCAHQMKDLGVHQSASDPKTSKGRNVSCTEQEMKQQTQLREILELTSRQVINLLHDEMPGKSPPIQETDNVVCQKTLSPKAGQSVIGSIPSDMPWDGNPKRKWNCPISEQKAWNQNDLQTALKPLDFSSFPSPEYEGGNTFSNRMLQRPEGGPLTEKAELQENLATTSVGPFDLFVPVSCNSQSHVSTVQSSGIEMISNPKCLTVRKKKPPISQILKINGHFNAKHRKKFQSNLRIKIKAMWNGDSVADIVPRTIYFISDTSDINRQNEVKEEIALGVSRCSHTQPTQVELSVESKSVPMDRGGSDFLKRAELPAGHCRGAKQELLIKTHLFNRKTIAVNENLKRKANPTMSEGLLSGASSLHRSQIYETNPEVDGKTGKTNSMQVGLTGGLSDVEKSCFCVGLSESTGNTDKSDQKKTFHFLKENSSCKLAGIGGYLPVSEETERQTDCLKAPDVSDPKGALSPSQSASSPPLDGADHSAASIRENTSSGAPKPFEFGADQMRQPSPFQSEVPNTMSPKSIITPQQTAVYLVDQEGSIECGEDFSTAPVLSSEARPLENPNNELKATSREITSPKSFALPKKQEEPNIAGTMWSSSHANEPTHAEIIRQKDMAKTTDVKSTTCTSQINLKAKQTSAFQLHGYDNGSNKKGLKETIHQQKICQLAENIANQLLKANLDERCLAPPVKKLPEVKTEDKLPEKKHLLEKSLNESQMSRPGCVDVSSTGDKLEANTSEQEHAQQSIVRDIPQHYMQPSWVRSQQVKTHSAVKLEGLQRKVSCDPVSQKSEIDYLGLDILRCRRGREMNSEQQDALPQQSSWKTALWEPEITGLESVSFPIKEPPCLTMTKEPITERDIKPPVLQRKKGLEVPKTPSDSKEQVLNRKLVAQQSNSFTEVLLRMKVTRTPVFQLLRMTGHGSRCKRIDLRCNIKKQKALQQRGTGSHLVPHASHDSGSILFQIKERMETKRDEAQPQYPIQQLELKMSLDKRKPSSQSTAEDALSSTTGKSAQRITEPEEHEVVLLDILPQHRHQLMTSQKAEEPDHINLNNNLESKAYHVIFPEKKEINYRRHNTPKPTSDTELEFLIAQRVKQGVVHIIRHAISLPQGTEESKKKDNSSSSKGQDKILTESEASQQKAHKEGGLPRQESTSMADLGSTACPLKEPCHLQTPGEEAKGGGVHINGRNIPCILEKEEFKKTDSLLSSKAQKNLGNLPKICASPTGHTKSGHLSSTILKSAPCHRRGPLCVKQTGNRMRRERDGIPGSVHGAPRGSEQSGLTDIPFKSNGKKVEASELSRAKQPSNYNQNREKIMEPIFSCILHQLHEETTKKQILEKATLNSNVLNPMVKKVAVHVDQLLCMKGTDLLVRGRKYQKGTGDTSATPSWMSIHRLMSSQGKKASEAEDNLGRLMGSSEKWEKKQKCTDEVLPKLESPMRTDLQHTNAQEQQVKLDAENMTQTRKVLKQMDVAGEFFQSRKKGQKQHHLSTFYESFGKHLSGSQTYPHLQPHVEPHGGETLSGAENVLKRTKALDSSSEAQRRCVQPHGLKCVVALTIPYQMKTQKTILPLESESSSETIKRLDVLSPQRKQSSNAVQVVKSTSKLGVGKKEAHKASQKEPAEVCLHRIFSHSLSICMHLLNKTKMQKGGIKPGVMKDITCPERLVENLALPVLFSATDPDTPSRLQELHWERERKMTHVRYRKEEANSAVAEEVDIVPALPYCRMDREIEGVIPSHVRRPHAAQEEEERRKAVEGMMDSAVTLGTEKSALSPVLCKEELPLRLCVIEQQSTGQDGAGKSGMKVTTSGISLPCLSQHNLNSRIKEGRKKAGILKNCFPPSLKSQRSSRVRKVSFSESCILNSATDSKCLAHEKRQGGRRAVDLNAIVGLVCAALQQDCSLKYVQHGKEPPWNKRRKEREKVTQGSKRNLGLVHNKCPGSILRSPHLEWDPKIRETYTQGIARFCLPSPTLRELSGTLGIEEESTDDILSSIKNAKYRPLRGRWETASEEIMHSQRIALREKQSSMLQELEVNVEEKEKKIQENGVENHRKSCMTSPNSEVDIRINGKEAMEIKTKFPCQQSQVQDSLPILNNVKDSIQNVIQTRDESTKVEKDKPVKEKVSSLSHEIQLDIRDQKKTQQKSRDEPNMVVTNTSTYSPSHLKLDTKIEKEDNVIIISSRYSLLELPCQKSDELEESKELVDSDITSVSHKEKTHLPQREEDEAEILAEKILHTKNEDWQKSKAPSQVLLQSPKGEGAKKEQKKASTKSRHQEKTNEVDEEKVDLAEHEPRKMDAEGKQQGKMNIKGQEEENMDVEVECQNIGNQEGIGQGKAEGESQRQEEIGPENRERKEEQERLDPEYRHQGVTGREVKEEKEEMGPDRSHQERKVKEEKEEMGPDDRQEGKVREDEEDIQPDGRQQGTAEVKEEEESQKLSDVGVLAQIESLGDGKSKEVNPVQEYKAQNEVARGEMITMEHTMQPEDMTSKTNTNQKLSQVLGQVLERQGKLAEVQIEVSLLPSTLDNRKVQDNPPEVTESYLSPSQNMESSGAEKSKYTVSRSSVISTDSNIARSTTHVEEDKEAAFEKSTTHPKDIAVEAKPSLSRMPQTKQLPVDVSEQSKERQEGGEEMVEFLSKTRLFVTSCIVSRLDMTNEEKGEAGTTQSHAPYPMLQESSSTGLQTVVPTQSTVNHVERGTKHPPTEDDEVQALATDEVPHSSGPGLQAKTYELPWVLGTHESSTLNISNNPQWSPKDKVGQKQEETRYPNVVVRMNHATPSPCLHKFPPQDKLSLSSKAGKVGCAVSNEDITPHNGIVIASQQGLCEETKDSIKREAVEDGRLKATSLKMRISPPAHLYDRKVQHLSTKDQREEVKGGKKEPEVAPEGTASLCSCPYFLKGNTGVDQKGSMLERKRFSFPPPDMHSTLNSSVLSNKKGPVRSTTWGKEAPSTVVRDRKTSKLMDLRMKKFPLPSSSKELQKTKEPKFDLTNAITKVQLCLNKSSYADIMCSAMAVGELSSDIKKLKDVPQEEKKIKENFVGMCDRVDPKDICLKANTPPVLSIHNLSDHQSKTRLREKKAEKETSEPAIRQARISPSQSPPCSLCVSTGSREESTLMLTRFPVSSARPQKPSDSGGNICVQPVIDEAFLALKSGKQYVLEKAELDGTQRIKITMVPKYQELKTQEKKDGPSMPLTKYPSSSLPLSQLDNTELHLTELRLTKPAFQRTSNGGETEPTEQIAGDIMNDVTTLVPPKEDIDTKGAVDRRRTDTTLNTWKSPLSHKLYRTELHVNIGGHKQKEPEGQGEPQQHKVTRQICTAKPSPAGVRVGPSKRDKKSEASSQLLLMTSALADVQTISGIKAMSGNVREEKHGAIPKEKAVNMKTGVYGKKAKIPPISQILATKEFVVNMKILDQSRHRDGSEPRTVLTRTFISTPPAFPFPVDSQNKEEDMAEIAGPQQQLQESPGAQEVAYRDTVAEDGSENTVKKAEDRMVPRAAEWPGNAEVVSRAQNKSAHLQVKSEGGSSSQGGPIHFTGIDIIGSGNKPLALLLGKRALPEKPEKEHFTTFHSYPSLQANNMGNQKKNTEITDTLHHKVRAKLLIPLPMKTSKETFVTLGTPISARGFPAIEGDAHQSRTSSKLCPKSLGSAQFDKLEKDKQNPITISKLHSLKVLTPQKHLSYRKIKITKQSNPQNIADRGIITKKQVPQSPSVHQTNSSAFISVNFPLQKKLELPHLKRNIQEQKWSQRNVSASLPAYVFLSPQSQKGRLAKTHPKTEVSTKDLTMSFPIYPISEMPGMLGHSSARSRIKLEHALSKPNNMVSYSQDALAILHRSVTIASTPQNEETFASEIVIRKVKHRLSKYGEKSPGACGMKDTLTITKGATNCTNPDAWDPQPSVVKMQRLPHGKSEESFVSRTDKINITLQTRNRLVPGHDDFKIIKNPDLSMMEQNKKCIVSPSEQPSSVVGESVPRPQTSDAGGCSLPPKQSEQGDELGRDTSSREVQQQGANTQTVPTASQVEGDERKMLKECLFSIYEAFKTVFEASVGNIIENKFPSGGLEKVHDDRADDEQSPPPAEGPDTSSRTYSVLQGKPPLKHLTPEEKNKLTKHLASKVIEIKLNLLPEMAKISLQKLNFHSKVGISEDNSWRHYPRHKEMNFISPGVKEPSLKYSYQKDRVSRKVLIAGSSGKKDTVTRPNSIEKLGNGASAVTASASEHPPTPIFLKYSVEERDKLLMHISRKSLELQSETFSRIVSESYAMVNAQARSKPLPKCIHSAVKAPKKTNRLLLLFDKTALREIDLNLQQKYLRAVLGSSSNNMAPAPSVLAKPTPKSSTVPSCNKGDDSGRKCTLPIDQGLVQQHISFKKQNLQENSALFRKEPSHVHTLGPDLRGVEQKDTTGRLELKAHMTPRKNNRCHELFQKESAYKPSDFCTQQKAAGFPESHSARKAADGFTDTGIKTRTSPNPERSLAPKESDSEDCVFLETNFYLSQESDDFLFAVEKGIPLEKFLQMKEAAYLKPFYGEGPGVHQAKACRKHSLYTTLSSCDSHRSRKYRSSSKMQSSELVCHRSSGAGEIQSTASSTAFSEEKVSWTMQSKTAYPLTSSSSESSFKSHHVKDHLKSHHMRPESKDKKKIKLGLLRKSSVHQDSDNSCVHSEEQHRRKKNVHYCESERPYDSHSSHKSAAKRHREETNFCSERKPNRPFFYACISADSLNSAPKTIRWIIPQETLMKRNFRVPLVAKISNVLAISSSHKKLLGHFGKVR
uniref:coiled-coil domain-containing protein 168 n=1 Tax=Jaculus jaculus TaxID=51337 RepID=UPI001E1B492D|nr:coiled-coil domain-containing protein 168 [Jaculus jaculus]